VIYILAYIGAAAGANLIVAADPAPSPFQFIWQLPGAAEPAAMAECRRAGSFQRHVATAG
jgi:hypothetical protein